MASRQVHDMKVRSSELDAPIKDSPQTVTHCGLERTVLEPSKRNAVPSTARPSLKELLIGCGPRSENLIRKRRSFRRRPGVDLR
jgi:hypothetical protein